MCLYVREILKTCYNMQMLSNWYLSNCAQTVSILKKKYYDEILKNSRFTMLKAKKVFLPVLMILSIFCLSLSPNLSVTARRKLSS